MIGHMKKLIFDSEEAKLKEKREEASYNVILSGLKEVDNETSSVLTSKVVDVLSSFHPPVSFRAERLGKPLTDRPRLVKLHLTDKKNRSSLLCSASKLKLGSFKNIYLNADRTFLDRKEHARLREKANSLSMSNSDAHITFQNGSLRVDGVEIDKANPLQHLFPRN